VRSGSVLREGREGDEEREEGAGIEGREAEGALAVEEGGEPESGVAEFDGDEEIEGAPDEMRDESVGRVAGQIFSGEDEAERESAEEFFGFASVGGAGAAGFVGAREEEVESGGVAEEEEFGERDGEEGGNFGGG
jgi:hypothetical protein